MESLHEIEHKLKQMLGPFKVEVYFGKEAVEDLKAYKKQMTLILALIIAMARKGPLIKPHGLGEPLHGSLVGFCKIKPKAMSLRIIYRPVKNEVIRMEVIAIGPRDKEEVYELAAERVRSFKEQMAARS